ncbi:MAG: PAS domain S-box protein [Firmicutes bacterium]|nr:PAS domain S-box protein [Bacillota bacterium]
MEIAEKTHDQLLAENNQLRQQLALYEEQANIVDAPTNGMGVTAEYYEAPIWVTDLKAKRLRKTRKNELFGDDGKIIDAIAAFEDISERIQVQESLQKERGILRAVIENTETQLVYLDPEFNFIWVNSAYAKGCRRPVEDFIGRNHFELFPHEENEAIFRKVCDTGKPILFKAKPFVHPDRPEQGVTYWDWMLTPITDCFGKVTGLVLSLTDVTEMVRTEETLRETKDYLENLINYANAPIIVWDSNFKIIRFNRAFERLTGYSADYVLGRSLEILFPDDRKKESMDIIGRTASGEYWEVVEIPILQKGGNVRIVLWNSANISDESGKIVATIAQGQDITERKIAEESLRKSQQRDELLSTVASRLLSSEDPQAIIEELCHKTIDHLGCDVFLNYMEDREKGYLHLNACTGIPEDEARKIEWLDYGSAVCGCVALEGQRIIVENISEFHDPRTDKVRTYGILAYACYPLKMIDRVIGTISFGTRSRSSFTDEELVVMKSVADQIAIAMSRLLTTRQLRESEARLEELVRERTRELYDSNQRMVKTVESITDTFFSLDREWLVTYWNRAAEDMFDLKREEILGRNFWEVFPRAVESEFYTQYRLAMRLNNPVNFEAMEAHTGRWVEARAYPSQVGLTIYLNDITEQKRLGEEIARLDRLNLVGEMAASIGHEIRNPMTTIRGFLQILASKKGCQLYREYFDLMIEELDRANSIITDYLSMAKDKAVDMNPRYLNSIIRTIHPLIQADANYSDKQVRLDLDLPPKLLLDEKEVRQLILNLARNGLEAMGPGGILTIRTHVENSETVLEVGDQGSGIPPAMMDRLGTPFHTTKENGTGLGLAVCYSIAHRHNAKIEVDTGPEGTTFRVRFKPNSDP